jgi:predicted oxidoreductase
MPSPAADAIDVRAGLAGLVAATELTAVGKKVLVVDQELRANLRGQAFWPFGASRRPTRTRSLLVVLRYREHWRTLPTRVPGRASLDAPPEHIPKKCQTLLPRYRRSRETISRSGLRGHVLLS